MLLMTKTTYKHSLGVTHTVKPRTSLTFHVGAKVEDLDPVGATTDEPGWRIC